MLKGHIPKVIYHQEYQCTKMNGIASRRAWRGALPDEVGLDGRCRSGRFRGTSLIRNSLPLGPYSRTMHRALGGGAVSYERGSPVLEGIVSSELAHI
jgi:hypothetical protein